MRECLLYRTDFVFLDAELKLQVFSWKLRHPCWMWYSISVTCVPLLCNWYYVYCACRYLSTATSCGQYGQHFLSVIPDYSFTLQLRTELGMGVMMSMKRSSMKILRMIFVELPFHICTDPSALIGFPCFTMEWVERKAQFCNIYFDIKIWCSLLTP